MGEAYLITATTTNKETAMKNRTYRNDNIFAHLSRGALALQLDHAQEALQCQTALANMIEATVAAFLAIPTRAMAKTLAQALGAYEGYMMSCWSSHGPDYNDHWSVRQVAKSLYPAFDRTYAQSLSISEGGEVEEFTSMLP